MVLHAHYYRLPIFLLRLRRGEEENNTKTTIMVIDENILISAGAETRHYTPSEVIFYEGISLIIITRLLKEKLSLIIITRKEKNLFRTFYPMEKAVENLFCS